MADCLRDEVIDDKLLLKHDLMWNPFVRDHKVVIHTCCLIMMTIVVGNTTLQTDSTKTKHKLHDNKAMNNVKMWLLQQ